MTIPNSKHLLALAKGLTVSPQRGPPRQARLRGAVSTAYYGFFHADLKAAADTFVGATKSASPEWHLAYRACDHREIKEICSDITKSYHRAEVLTHVRTSAAPLGAARSRALRRAMRRSQSSTVSTLPRKYAPDVPGDSFGQNIIAFATTFINLKKKRHSADYDPMFRTTSQEVVRLVKLARTAIKKFNEANNDERSAFPALILFRVR